MRQQALKVPIVTSGIISDAHILQSPAAFEGVYQSQIRDPDQAATLTLAEKYKQHFKADISMTWFVATGYDGIMLLAQGMRKVGANSEKLKDYLQTLKDYPGAAQKISFNTGGSSPYYSSMYQIRNGKFELVE